MLWQKNCKWNLNACEIAFIGKLLSGPVWPSHVWMCDKQKYHHHFLLLKLGKRKTLVAGRTMQILLPCVWADIHNSHHGKACWVALGQSHKEQDSGTLFYQVKIRKGNLRRAAWLVALRGCLWLWRFVPVWRFALCSVFPDPHHHHSQLMRALSPCAVICCQVSKLFKYLI